MVSILCTYLERASVEKRSDSTNISNRIGFLLYDFDICICFRFFIIGNLIPYCAAFGQILSMPLYSFYHHPWFKILYILRYEKEQLKK